MKNKTLLTIPFLLTVLVLLWSFAGMTAGSHTAHAAGPWYVAPGGDDADDCLSWATACATLGGAISKASSGDTIYMAAGTYDDTNVFISKNLTIIGAGMDDTVLDGAADGRVMYISGSSVVSVSGLTVRNGSSQSGGGIYHIGDGLTLDGVRLTGNTASSTGGGLYAAGPLTMTNSIVDHNQAASNDGGGIYLNTTSAVLIENTAIYSNTAGYRGCLLYTSPSPRD